MDPKEETLYGRANLWGPERTLMTMTRMASSPMQAQTSRSPQRICHIWKLQRRKLTSRGNARGAVLVMWKTIFGHAGSEVRLRTPEEDRAMSVIQVFQGDAVIPRSGRMPTMVKDGTGGRV